MERKSSNVWFSATDPNAPTSDPHMIVERRGSRDDVEFDDPPPPSSRDVGRRNSEAEFQEKPPMTFGLAATGSSGSGLGPKRGSQKHLLKQQGSRSSMTKQGSISEMHQDDDPERGAGDNERQHGEDDDHGEHSGR